MKVRDVKTNKPVIIYTYDATFNEPDPIIYGEYATIEELPSDLINAEVAYCSEDNGRCYIEIIE